MIDIQAYIEESLFSDKSDEQSVTQKVNDMLTIKNIPEDLEGVLDYYCAWYKILYNTGMVQGLVDRSIQKQYLNIVLEVFLNNLPKYSLSLSEYNIETIEQESYQLHIPATGYTQSWDKLFELKPIRKEDIEKEIKETTRQICAGKYIVDFIPSLFFIKSNLVNLDYDKLFNIISSRYYSCVVQPKKLHGSISWKTTIRKRTKQYINNITDVISNLGVPNSVSNFF